MSIYDPRIWDNKVSAAVIGGRNRAIKALRDKFGRFLPDDEFMQTLWTLPECHGVEGGRKRAQTAKRIQGKFRKD